MNRLADPQAGIPKVAQKGRNRVAQVLVFGRTPRGYYQQVDVGVRKQLAPAVSSNRSQRDILDLRPSGQHQRIHLRGAFGEVYGSAG
jgi:hypothetical protein